MAHSTLAHILSERALDLLNCKGGYHIMMEEKNRFNGQLLDTTSQRKIGKCIYSRLIDWLIKYLLCAGLVHEWKVCVCTPPHTHTQMGNNLKCSTSLIMKEMQNKTTMKILSFSCQIGWNLFLNEGVGGRYKQIGFITNFWWAQRLICCETLYLSFGHRTLHGPSVHRWQEHCSSLEDPLRPWERGSWGYSSTPSDHPVSRLHCQPQWEWSEHCPTLTQAFWPRSPPRTGRVGGTRASRETMPTRSVSKPSLNRHRGQSYRGGTRTLSKTLNNKK